MHVVGLAFALAAVSLSSSISLAAGLYTNRLLGVSLKVCMYGMFVWYSLLIYLYECWYFVSLKAGVMMTVYEQVNDLKNRIIVFLVQ